ncbi:MAG: TonB-dependent receptor plug domain-containing protein [Motiliproteus sp.]|nr:TonB-dependent receptor plug domain-containing protein [Motiliproteus sp.]MCW9051683.1 TonB-dependent receptor plug domain-containing protein [Motiliproteus sp.]
MYRFKKPSDNWMQSLPLSLVLVPCLQTISINHAYAEETTSATALSPITVEATSESEVVPGASHISLEELKQQNPTTSDTASLLSNVPGVSLNGAGGISSLPSIRGLADDRLRIKVDGMDLIASCPNHMNPPLSYVNPSNISEIKVFAGIAPVSQSGDSIGSSIVVETAEPEFAPEGQDSLVTGEVGTFYRSNNDAFGANASATYASDSFSIKYSGSWSKANNYSAADDFKTFTASGRTGHELALDEVGSTAYETQDHSLSFAAVTEAGLFEAGIGYQKMPEQLYPNQRMDLLDNEQIRLNFGHTGEFDWGMLETRVYHEKVDHYMNFGGDKQLIYM